MSTMTVSKKAKKDIKKINNEQRIYTIFPLLFYYIEYSSLRVRWTNLNKYDKLLIFPAMIVIIAGIFSGFSNQSYDQLAKEILKERTEILQNAFYGKIERHEAEEALSKIETYPLLSEDIESLKHYDASQLDVVKNMDFLEVEQVSKMFDYISFHIKIRWDMSGLSADYISDNEYSVILKSTKSGYKLSEFNPKSQY